MRYTTEGWLHRKGLHSEAAQWLVYLQADVKENRRLLRLLSIELIAVMFAVWGVIVYLVVK